MEADFVSNVAYFLAFIGAGKGKRRRLREFVMGQQDVLEVRQIVVRDFGNREQLGIVGGGIGASGIICGADLDEDIVDDGQERGYC
jgi:hypothetical protein